MCGCPKGNLQTTFERGFPDDIMTSYGNPETMSSFHVFAGHGLSYAFQWFWLLLYDLDIFEMEPNFNTIIYKPLPNYLCIFE